MRTEIALQIASKARDIPKKTLFKQWILSAILSPYEIIEICLRIVDEAESQDLNHRYRQKNKSTNVLSFPYHETGDQTLIGDIIICAPIVGQEAIAQSKPLIAHWAHLSIHACLHLQGFDHENEIDASIMENHEITILKRLGFNNPYLI
jgi:probable rRNA maturation factor